MECSHTLPLGGRTQGFNHLVMHLCGVLQICQMLRTSHGFLSFSLGGQLDFSSTAQRAVNREDGWEFILPGSSWALGAGPMLFEKTRQGTWDTPVTETSLEPPVRQQRQKERPISNVSPNGKPLSGKIWLLCWFPAATHTHPRMRDSV